MHTADAALCVSACDIIQACAVTMRCMYHRSIHLQDNLSADFSLQDIHSRHAIHPKAHRVVYIKLVSNQGTIQCCQDVALASCQTRLSAKQAEWGGYSQTYRATCSTSCLLSMGLGDGAGTGGTAGMGGAESHRPRGRYSPLRSPATKNREPQ